MIGEEAALSLPYRLAVSMLVIALTVPVCLNSLQDGRIESERRAAVEVGQLIAYIASDISVRPSGEMRTLTISELLREMGHGIIIEIGDEPGGINSMTIRCAGVDGWIRTILVESVEAITLCGIDGKTASLNDDFGDARMSHVISQGYDIILLEEA